ncbi:hypothetical protein N665_0076s0206 [Sinapis alba]|nr:hypothetical protein N665_0076s0206 [Sinapis alba]
MKVYENPITGSYQTADQFWDHVVEAFKNGKPKSLGERSKKSLQCRFQTIERATKKLHACIKQCENRHSNGVSNFNICNQAKQMLMEDPKFKSGWKYDHVWNIIKNSEKFEDGVTYGRKISDSCGFESTYSDSENPTTNSEIQASPIVSSFSINLRDKDYIIGGSLSQQPIDGSLSQRPIGVRKTTMKRKSDDQTSAVIKILKEGNNQLLEQLKKTSALIQNHMEIQNKNYALKKFKEENIFLFQDLNSIQDANIRAYVQSEQKRILRKRVDQKDPSASTSLEQ